MSAESDSVSGDESGGGTQSVCVEFRGSVNRERI